MEEFIESWSYLGIFVGIIATGLGFPMPEELPVVLAGGLSGHPENGVYWWIMLPVCVMAVLIGDTCLYLIGRHFGRRLLKNRYVSARLLTPARLEKISRNFREYGVKILLFARLTPGIRAPIFLTAGITKLPLTKFLFADGIYAIPGVSLLFFLGYWFTDSMVALLGKAEKAKPIIIMVVVVAIAGYVAYRFLRRPVVTGTPNEMPPVVGPVAEKLETIGEMAAGKIFHCPPDCAPDASAAATAPAAPNTPAAHVSNGENGTPASPIVGDHAPREPQP